MTLKEIAKLLNISPSTVSRALSNSYEVSEKTRLKVQALANELNFQPNPNASSLRRNKNKTIAVILPDITNHFFAKVIEGIETIAQQKGYHILIYFTFENFIKEKNIIHHLSNGRVDGVIISLSAETQNFEHIQLLKDRNVPLVFFDRVSENIVAAKITTDNYQAALKGTKHLLQKGCKKIAFLNFSNYSSTCVDRKKGYLDALNEAKITANSALVLECTTNADENFELIKNLLNKNKNIDAVLASAESLSIITYKACDSLGIKIPEKLKVLGFSNLSLAAQLSPALSTITQPALEMGKEAATVLFKSIEKPNVDYTDVVAIFKSTLIERKSTSII
ncbi:MAG: LacI family DNA-binding transcriptional regulator [Chitinophagaceae bacterium]